MSTTNSQAAIEVTKQDLPLHCPVADGELWGSHPRVFIPIEESGEASCPYCGTQYRLVTAANPPSQNSA